MLRGMSTVDHYCKLALSRSLSLSLSLSLVVFILPCPFFFYLAPIPPHPFLLHSVVFCVIASLFLSFWSNTWMCVIGRIHLSLHPTSFMHDRIFTSRCNMEPFLSNCHTTYKPCIRAFLTSTISHLFQWPSPWLRGHKVNGKQDLLGSASHTLVN